jgi:hypothetical protein
MWKAAVSKLNGQSWTANKWWRFSSMGIGPGVTTACHKEKLSYELLHNVSELNRILGMIYAPENGHTPGNLECWAE